MRTLDGVSAFSLLLLASFAIDRIVTALLFVLSMLHVFPEARLLEDAAARVTAENKYKFFYFLVAGVLGFSVVALYPELRLLHALGRAPGNSLVDILLTGIVLVGGADRLAAIWKPAGGGDAETASGEQLRISGRVTLEEDTGSKAKAASQGS